METTTVKETRRLTWYQDSPDAGPNCLCSICGNPIHGTPRRVFGCDETLVVNEARFHDCCYDEISYAFTGIGRKHESNMPGYIFAKGMYIPRRWQDDRSGRLPQAVMAYLYWEPDMNPLDPPLLRLLVDYLIHYIDAPCWNGNFVPEIADLRLQAGSLQSANDVRAWIEACMVIGLDPL